MVDVKGYLSKQQIDNILACAKNKRNWLLLFLLYRSGRRISELLELKPIDIDQDKKLIKFHILKKKNKNTYKLKAVDDDAIDKLNEYIDENGIPLESYVFPSPKDHTKHLTRQMAFYIVKKTCKLAGIHRVGLKEPHPHHFRHSFAISYLSNSRKKEVAIRALQEILDHANLNMTSSYLQFSQEDVKEDLNYAFGVKKKDV